MLMSGMDPDIARPSIEAETLPDAPQLPLPSTQQPNLPTRIKPETVPLPPSSPLKSPYSQSRSPARPQTPRVVARSPSSASSYNDRQGSPALRTKHSSSSLSAARGVTPSRTPQFRRASSNLNPSIQTGAMGPGPEPEKKVLTASMVAKDYFHKELANQAATQTDVTVFVHDSCYGHRFSRPRTTKTNLGAIVERPERIHATMLGASTAYVRLGGRHADGNHGPHPEHEAPVSSVPFKIQKTTRFIPLDHPAVTHVHGTKWMQELQIMCDSAESKLAINGKELARPIGYGKDESGSPLPKLHEGDLYLCSESLNALQGCLGGVCDAIDSAFAANKSNRAFVCIRPPGHHCSSNVPSGFCWLNNVHVGITYAAMDHGLTHAVVIDFDLHHGDGSQALTWAHNRSAQSLPKNAASYKKTPIGYYSLHDINSYPCEMGDEEKVRNASLCIDNAHGQSIWNVHLESWETLNDFWKLYQTKYLVLLEKASKFLRHHTKQMQSHGQQPKAAIFISAGFDASQWEMPGMQRHEVNVPTDFYAKFTADIVKMAQEDGLGVDGRVISVLEGGYSDRALTSGVLSHLCGLVDEPSRNVNTDFRGGIASAVARSMDSDQSNGNGVLQMERYEAGWWSADALEMIEALVAGNMPQLPTTKKDKDPSHYSSPTHASSARMTEHARERKSLSSQFDKRLSMEAEAPPPPPKVEWAVASYELSRLIIPSDRQTLSFRHDELNAEATKVRRERQSNIGVTVANTGEPMQLRERRGKPVALPSVPSRSSSRSGNRRTTIASVNDLPDPSLEASNGGPANRPRRRSSGASSIVSGFSEMKLGNATNNAVGEQKNGQLPPTAPSTAGAQAKDSKAPAVRKPKTTAIKPTARPKTSPRKPTSVVRAGSRSRPNSSSSEHMSGRAVSVGVSKALDVSHRAANDRKSTETADDMDTLTNAMKKTTIKLKMPTQEEHAAKLKRAEEDQKKITKPAKRPPAVRAPRSKNNATVGPAKQPQARPSSVESNTQTEKRPLESNSAEMVTAQPSQTPTQLAESAPVITEHHSFSVEPGAELLQTLTDKTDTLMLDASDLIDVPHADMPPVRAGDQEPLMAPPPAPFFTKETLPLQSVPSTDQNIHAFDSNTSTNGHHSVMTDTDSRSTLSSRPWTPNKKTKADLPTFTSSSPIPFAQARDPVTAESNFKSEIAKSVWDVPETPQK